MNRISYFLLRPAYSTRRHTPLAVTISCKRKLAQAAALFKMFKSASDWMEIRPEDSVAKCVAKLRAQGYECIAATAPPCDNHPSVDLYAAVPPPVSLCSGT